MEKLLTKVGKTAIRVSLKALAAVCTGILSVIEMADKPERKGGKVIWQRK